MKNLIVNADEFGLTRSVSEGIIYAFKNGIVTNTTLMVNMPSSEHAFDIIRKNPDLKVGIHLNLSDGKPVLESDSVKTLIDEDGNFLALGKLLARVVTGKVSYLEIENEVRAQIKKAIDNGINITHLDSHRHFHMYPAILRRIIKVAKEFSINKIRYSYENSSLGLMDNLLKFTFVKKQIVSLCSLMCKPILVRNNIKFNQYFIGMSQIGTKNQSEVFRKLLHNVKDGTTELICHPGHVDEELKRINPYVQERENELGILTSIDIQTLVKEQDINLISYGDI